MERPVTFPAPTEKLPALSVPKKSPAMMLFLLFVIASPAAGHWSKTKPRSCVPDDGCPVMSMQSTPAPSRFPETTI